MSAAPKLRPLALPLGVVVTLAGGCEAKGDDEGACGEAQPCDVPASRAELLEALDGFEDPVAAWLRVATDGEVTVMTPPLTYRIRTGSLAVMRAAATPGAA